MLEEEPQTVHDRKELTLVSSVEPVPPAAPVRFPTHVFIDLPNWLGDLIMAFPATDRILRANHGGRTTLHVRPASATLVSMVFPQADVIVTGRRENPIHSFRRVRRSGGSAELGVTMRNAARAKLLLRFVSRYSIGTASQGGRSLLRWTHESSRDRHQVHDADEALRHLNLQPVDADWTVTPSASMRILGRRALARASVDPDAKTVGLAPGVAWGGSAKRWPERHFGRLAVLLKRRGFHPVLVIGPGEGPIARAVIDAAGFDIPVVAERLDAAGLAGILACLTALVGNDSGPAHLASIFRTPVVALFGPTDPRRTAPTSSSSVVLRRTDLSCLGCGAKTCPLPVRACMDELLPEEVLQSVASAAVAGPAIEHSPASISVLP